jgi:hypothetical protein
MSNFPAFSASASAPRADAGNPTSSPAASSVFVPASPTSAVVSGPPGAPRIGDPLGALPVRAREKYLTIRDAAFDAFALTRPIREAVDQARDRVSELKRHLEHQEKALWNRRNEPEIQRLQAELAVANAELGRQERRYSAATAKAAPLKAVANALESYVTNHGGFSEAEAVEVSIPKGKTAAEALEAQRKVIEALRLERKAISAAPNHSSYAREKARAFVDSWAQNGEPEISVLFETKDPLTLAGCYDRRPEGPHVLAFLMWACKDEILRKLDAMIAENAEDEAALSDWDRLDRLREVEAKILQGERVEELLVEACLAANIPVERRRDADPRAILGVNGPKPRD